MSLIPVSSSYKALWENSREPRLLHFTAIREEASLHPRVMQSHSEYAELVLVLSGDGEYFIDGQLHPVHPGDLVVFNPGVAHDQRTAPGASQTSYSLAVAGLDLAHCRKNALLPDQASPVFPCGEAEAAVRHLFETLHLYMKRDLPGAPHIVHALTQAILLQTRELSKHCPRDLSREQRDEIPLATRVRTYLDENFCEDLSLQMLAERFNISSYYLAHIFKDQFGYPPLQYILRRRIGLAQTLLITTQLPVGEIGARVGYYNPSHFNLIFTKNVGISPRKYRMNYFN